MPTGVYPRARLRRDMGVGMTKGITPRPFSRRQPAVAWVGSPPFASPSRYPAWESRSSTEFSSMSLRRPYLMFLGTAPDQLAAKTAQGIVHWRPDWCLGQLRLPGCKADLGLKGMTVADAA